MRLVFNPVDGRILSVLRDADGYYNTDEYGVTVEEFVIEELPEDPNWHVCRDILKVEGKIDNQQRPKYYMDNSAGIWELHEVDGWEVWTAQWLR